MTRHFRPATSLAAFALAASLPAAATPAAAGVRQPVILASASSYFDQACVAYYNEGNDPDVMTDYGIPASFCECLANWYVGQGLAVDALDFYARSYQEDLTTFVHEYPQGDAWMEKSFTADVMCKSG